jgi:aminoglycoside/choline kinase family phosphotransferase
MPQRFAALRQWLQDDLRLPLRDLRPLTNDASFRRYFRVHLQEGTQVAMDAPPERENSRPYLEIARRLHRAGLHVPEILAENSASGFFLLSDLGDDLYLPALDEARVERLYGDALAALATMQACVSGQGLPPYDRKLLLAEMRLFTDWLLPRHLHWEPAPDEARQLEDCFTFLADTALAQPQVFVHRDYHSRNLMICSRHNPGILDFQDAVHGPVTYDLVSLLRDCYLVWPRARVEEWALGYRELAQQTGILAAEVEERQFLRWFDLMGLQRHIKVAGIFARLWHRDHKAGYLKDIPTALRYIAEVAADYPQTQFLSRLTTEKVLPAMLASLNE